MRQFELPENACAYTFEGCENKEKIAVVPGDTFILGGIAFALGNGIRGIDKRGLIEETI